MRRSRDSNMAHRRTDGKQRVAIAGTGSYVPKRVLSNADLEKMVETTNEWIVTRSGIRERRIAGPDEATSDMAAAAGRHALEAAGVSPQSVDLIIVATVTPDMLFPSTACLVQDSLGARQAVCFDVEAACCGFIYGVEIAEHMISCGSRNTALIIGAEKLSSITDWQDRTTCVLFGDGAGAVVLRPSPEGCGIVNTHMGSDGSLCSLLHVPAGGSRRPATEETVKQRLHYMRMNGKEVFKYAVRAMADSVARVLDHTRLTLDDVDCIIPHQANIRIIDAIRERLGVAPEKFFCNLDRYGNMSAASIPVALDEAVRCGRIKKHDIVLMVAFGGGFTWGATVLEW